MAKEGLQLLLLTPLILALSLAAGCADDKGTVSPTSATQAADGGQDTGGGFVLYSERKAVLEALKTSIELLSEIDPEKNIAIQFFKDQGFKSEVEEIAQGTHLFKDLRGFESPALSALGKNKINYLEKGNCLESESHIDASVSEIGNLQSDLCVSLENLRRIPPSSLLREVLSLMLHEATHLGGAQEEDAKSWQKEFSEYFGKRFGEISRESVVAPTFQAIMRSQNLIRDSLEMAERWPKDPRIFTKIGKVVEELESLPGLNDELAFKIKVKPKNLRDFRIYSNSAKKLINKLYMKFEIHKIDFKLLERIRVPLSLMPPDKVFETLQEIENDLHSLSVEFLNVIDEPTSPSEGLIFSDPFSPGPF